MECHNIKGFREHNPRKYYQSTFNAHCRTIAILHYSFVCSTDLLEQLLDCSIYYQSMGFCQEIPQWWPKQMCCVFYQNVCVFYFM